MAIENGVSPWEARRTHRLVALGFAVVAFVLLAMGSYATILSFFGPVDNPARLSRSDVIAYGALLFWPLTVAGFWLVTLPVFWIIGRPWMIVMTTAGAVASVACPFIAARLLHFPSEGIESGGLPGVVIRAVVVAEMVVIGSGWAAIIWHELVQPLYHAHRDARFQKVAASTNSDGPQSP